MKVRLWPKFTSFFILGFFHSLYKMLTYVCKLLPKEYIFYVLCSIKSLVW